LVGGVAVLVGGGVGVLVGGGGGVMVGGGVVSDSQERDSR